VKHVAVMPHRDHSAVDCERHSSQLYPLDQACLAHQSTAQGHRIPQAKDTLGSVSDGSFQRGAENRQTYSGWKAGKATHIRGRHAWTSCLGHAASPVSVHHGVRDHPVCSCGPSRSRGRGTTGEEVAGSRMHLRLRLSAFSLEEQTRVLRSPRHPAQNRSSQPGPLLTCLVRH
jgi:hypothetical protein